MKDKFIRLVAALIDHAVSLVVSYIPTGIVTLGKFDTTPLSILTFIISYLVLILLKDLTFKNASVGKRILKLKIVKTSGKDLKTADVILRNIPILLLPIEILLILSGNERLGDLWTKTAVVSLKSQT